jgi:glycosyltransferase involved in cell wall biosynthesis
MNSEKNQYITQCKSLNCCVVIPTYNNVKTLERVILGVFEYAEDVIIVNDGATDGSDKIIDKFKERVTVITHNPNKGKGRALRNAFVKAKELGFDYIISIDSDGQHYPSDLPKFYDAIEKNKGAVIMGSRNMAQASVPGKSSFGNKFSNFWFKLETGISLPDTQTGYRAYPIKAATKRGYFTSKFEFEIEVLVKLAWRDCKIIPIPIEVLYDPDERVSHFRPFWDFFRISCLNVYFVTLTVLWFFPRRMFRAALGK